MKTNSKTKNINFKILISFLLIVSIVIFLTWLLEIVLFEPIYKETQINQVQNIDNEIIENYTTYDTNDYMEISMKNNCNIVVFKLVDNNITIVTNTSRTSNNMELTITLNDFLNKLGTQSNASYSNRAQGNETINIGAVQSFDGENIYFYVNSIITPINSVIKVSTILLLIISIVSMAITIVVSIILSKKISKPLQQLSNQAEQLSTGNLNIEFNATGYSEVEKLSNTLNYSIQEIKKSETLQKEVIQNVSHELRTPLTLIESYAELIEDYSGDNAAKRQQHIDIILDESKKLEHLINDMIDLSKMQSNTLIYSKEKFDLTNSIQKFEVFYKTKYKDFAFTFNYPKHCYIFADKQRIEQVITNLINNAINYSQLENKRIVVSLKKNKSNNTYRFSVKDNGIGISKADQKEIFNRHFRSTSAKRAVAGSGIGLTIVKEILTYHKYNFGVESELGIGSLFYFDIKTPKNSNINLKTK